MTEEDRKLGLQKLAESREVIALLDEMLEATAQHKTASEQLYADTDRLQSWIKEGTPEGLEKVQLFLSQYATK